MREGAGFGQVFSGLGRTPDEVKLLHGRATRFLRERLDGARRRRPRLARILRQVEGSSDRRFALRC